jgi:hypothetical protein
MPIFLTERAQKPSPVLSSDGLARRFCIAGAKTPRRRSEGVLGAKSAIFRVFITFGESC